MPVASARHRSGHTPPCRRQPPATPARVDHAGGQMHNPAPPTPARRLPSRWQSAAHTARCSIPAPRCQQSRHRGRCWQRSRRSRTCWRPASPSPALVSNRASRPPARRQFRNRNGPACPLRIGGRAVSAPLRPHPMRCYGRNIRGKSTIWRGVMNRFPIALKPYMHAGTVTFSPENRRHAHKSQNCQWPNHRTLLDSRHRNCRLASSAQLFWRALVPLRWQEVAVPLSIIISLLILKYVPLTADLPLSRAAGVVAFGYAAFLALRLLQSEEALLVDGWSELRPSLVEYFACYGAAALAVVLMSAVIVIGSSKHIPATQMIATFLASLLL